MNKRLVLLLLLMATVSGCATASLVGRDEGLTPSFAYVTGRSMGSDSFFFSWDNKEKSIFDQHANFNVFTDGDYNVNKVHPGWYTVTSVGGLSGNPLLSVYLEPGRLTYIGDITLEFKRSAGGPNSPVPMPTNPPGMASGIPSPRSYAVSGSRMLTVQNNSEAVKNAIRKFHPDLAKDLDALFVYRPAQ